MTFWWIFRILLISINKSGLEIPIPVSAWELWLIMDECLWRTCCPPNFFLRASICSFSNFWNKGLTCRRGQQQKKKYKKYLIWDFAYVIMQCFYSHMVTLNIRRSQALPCRCGARLAVCRWRFPPPAAWHWCRWAEPAAGHGWCDWRWACTAPARQTGDTPRSLTRPSRYRRAACSQTHANVTPSLHTINLRQNQLTCRERELICVFSGNCT